jgi:hypothetical protein
MRGPSLRVVCALSACVGFERCRNVVSRELQIEMISKRGSTVVGAPVTKFVHWCTVPPFLFAKTTTHKSKVHKTFINARKRLFSLVVFKQSDFLILDLQSAYHLKQRLKDLRRIDNTLLERNILESHFLHSLRTRYPPGTR